MVRMLPGLPGSVPSEKAPYQTSFAIIAGSSQKSRRSKGVVSGTLVGPSNHMLAASSSGTTAVARSTGSGAPADSSQFMTMTHQVPWAGSVTSQYSHGPPEALWHPSSSGSGRPSPLASKPTRMSRSGDVVSRTSATSR